MMMDTVPAVCPFCPLHCDDVRIPATTSNETKRSEKTDCRRLDDALLVHQPAEKPTQARFQNLEGSEHIQSILDSIRDRDHWTVEANGVDLSTSKTLVASSNTGKLDLTVYRTATQQALASAMQRDGGIRATIGDVRRHADLVWYIGNVDQQVPRLEERLSKDDEPIQVLHSPAGMNAEQIAEIASAWNAGPEAPCSSDASVSHERKVLEESQPDYLAVILASDAFAQSDADLTAVMMMRMLTRRNQKHRAVWLSMEANATLESVSLWTTGRSVLSTVSPSVDIKVFGGAAGQTPTRCELQIGGMDPGPDQANSYLPSTVAGWDQNGVVIRGDSTVTLSLPLQMNSKASSAEEWLTRLIPSDKMPG